MLLGAYHPRLLLITTPSYSFNDRFIAPDAPPGTRQGVPRGKVHIARQVARSIKKFYNVRMSPFLFELDSTGGQENSGARGDILDACGLSAVPFEDLRLLEPRNVSQGSWQPVLYRVLDVSW